MKSDRKVSKLFFHLYISSPPCIFRYSADDFIKDFLDCLMKHNPEDS